MPEPLLPVVKEEILANIAATWREKKDDDEFLKLLDATLRDENPFLWEFFEDVARGFEDDDPDLADDIKDIVGWMYWALRSQAEADRMQREIRLG